MPDEVWAAFQIPIGLAFLLRSSVTGAVVALYPSPAGATESELELDGLGRAVRGQPGPRPPRARRRGADRQPHRATDAPVRDRRRSTSAYRLVGLDQVALGGHHRRPGRRRRGRRVLRRPARAGAGAVERRRAGRRPPPPPPSRRSPCSASSPCRIAAAPTLRFDLHVDDPLGRAIHTIALSTQIQIDPARRAYDAETRARLVDLFGAPERWASTTQAFRWAHVDALVPGFTGATSFALEVPCTYDLEVAASKYFYSLPDGEVPLSFLFNGMVLYRGEARPPAGRAGPVELHGALAHAGRRLEARDGRATTRAAAGSGCDATTLDALAAPQGRRAAHHTFDATVRGAAAVSAARRARRHAAVGGPRSSTPTRRARRRTRRRRRSASSTRRPTPRQPAHASTALKLQCIATGTRDVRGDRALPRGRGEARRVELPRRASAVDVRVRRRCAGRRALATEDFGGAASRVTVAVREHDGGAGGPDAHRGARALAAVDARRRRAARRGGRFLSPIAPPEEAATAVMTCANVNTLPGAGHARRRRGPRRGDRPARPSRRSRPRAAAACSTRPRSRRRCCCTSWR